MVAAGFLQTISLILWFVAVSGEDFSNGWGEGIDWHSFHDGVKLSAELNKPMMLVIHKSWCGACKGCALQPEMVPALKPKFAESAAIKEMSSNFVMVNVVDDQEPSDPKFSPDGGYIPRVLFLDPSGNVLDKYYNENGNPSYKYYYPSPDNIAMTMQRVNREEDFAAKSNDEL